MVSLPNALLVNQPTPKKIQLLSSSILWCYGWSPVVGCKSSNFNQTIWGPWKPFSTLQCFFDENLPRTLRNYHSVGSLFVVTWPELLEQRNDLCFQFLPLTCWENPQHCYGMCFLVFVGLSGKWPSKILRKLRMSHTMMVLKAFAMVCWRSHCLQNKWSSGYLERQTQDGSIIT